MLTLRGLLDVPYWAQWAQCLRTRDDRVGETAKREWKEGEEEASKPAKKQLCGKMTDSVGLFAELEEGKTQDWQWECKKIGVIRL